MTGLIVIILLIAYSSIFGQVASDLDSGLVAYYPFNGSANDETENSNHGTVLGATLISDRCGTPESAYSFDGESAYIGYEHLLDNTDNFTISLWIRPFSPHEIDPETAFGLNSGISGQKYAIGPKQGNAGWGEGHAGVGISAGTNGISVYEHATNHMPAVLVWEGALNNLETNQSGWTHVVVVYNNKRPELYLNGDSVRIGLTSLKDHVHPSIEYHGAALHSNSTTPSDFFEGFIDDTRIYDRILSEDEIGQLTKPHSVTIPGLFNTGVDDCGIVQPPGIVEQHYSLRSSATPPIVIEPFKGFPPDEWIEPPDGSAWIGPSNSNISDPVDDYIYTLEFDLSGIDPGTFMISADVASDNTVRIFLNGVEKNLDGDQFRKLIPLSIESGFVVGMNILEFKVTNLSGMGLNPTGLLVANLRGNGTPPMPCPNPSIASITDIPNDQGKQVTVLWDRACPDTAGSEQPIRFYGIWRRADQIGAAKTSIAPNSATTRVQAVNSFDDMMAEAHNATPGISYEIAYGNFASASEVWTFVGVTPALQLEQYAFDAPTLFDSTAADGIVWSVFFISAHTDDALVWYKSQSDSGYSVDNLTGIVPMKGDVNFDGKVDVVDIMRMIEIFHNPDSATAFEFWAADLNDDNKINIVDIMGAVHCFHYCPNFCLLNCGNTPAKSEAQPLAKASLSFANITLESGNQPELPLDMNHEGLISGLQATLRFDPEVLKLAPPTPTQRSRSMELSVKQETGKLTFLLFSLSDETIEPGSGPILYFPTEATANHPSTITVSIENVIVLDADAGMIQSDLTSGNLSVATPLPDSYDLSQNYPNPFNLGTTINYQLPEPGRVSLRIFNSLGDEVRSLVGDDKEAGFQKAYWDGRNNEGKEVASGIYIYRISIKPHLKQSKSFVSAKKLVLLK